MARSIRVIVGLTLFFIAVYFVNGVLMRKTTRVDSVRDFLTSSKEDVDVIGIGSSHMYCTLNPIEMFRYAKIRAHILGTQRQPVCITEDYLNRALKRHRPKIVLIETLNFFSNDRPSLIEAGVAHDALDPLPLDLDKCLLLFSNRYLADVDSLLLPIIKYHSRWKTLKQCDWKLDFDMQGEDYPIKGFVVFRSVKSSNVKQIDYNQYQPSAMHPYYVDCLRRMSLLTLENDARLVLFTAPVPLSEEKIKRIVAIKEFASANNIPYIDLNQDFDKTGIDNGLDFYNYTHLNVKGSEKATRYIADRLVELIDFENEHSRPSAMAETEFRRYDAILKRLEK